MKFSPAMHVTEHALRSYTCSTGQIMDANHRPSDPGSAIFKIFMSGVQTPVASRVRLPTETTTPCISY